MKAFSLVTFLLFFSSFIYAQSNLDELVYLKNGTVYRGIIMEQIPNESLKIQTNEGKLISVSVNELSRITKEEKLPVMQNSTPQNFNSMPTFKIKKPLYFKPKGYFGYVENTLGYGVMNLKTVHGYKFCRMGYLGAGVGVEVFNYFQSHQSGAQIPLFLRYEGDLLNRKVSPFIEAELGWGFLLAGGDDIVTNRWSGFTERYKTKSGGPIGAIGLGIKVFTHSRFNLKLVPNFVWRVSKVEHIFSDGWEYYSKTETKFGGTFGLKIGFGF